MKRSWTLAAKLSFIVFAMLGITIVSCSGDTVVGAKTCSTGESLCGTSCVDFTSDPSNCGACGTACKATEVCNAGACALFCSGKSTQCGASCVDVNVSPTNCGKCGTSCNPGEVCNAGTCSAQCPGNQKLCIGDGGAVSCIAPNTDSANCGGCGIVCAAGKVCSSGVCSDSCGGGGTLCNGQDGGGPYCALTQVDNANCGMCGKVCTNGLVCVNGACAGNCGPGEILCPGQDGGASYCAVIQSDNSNCGACGNVCAPGLLCSAKTCVAQCSAGLTQCGKQCVDIQSDRDNCNGCGIKCSGATPNCIGSKCGKGIVYSENFPSGTVQSTDPQCVNWLKFNASLIGVFSGVQISGSNDSTGFSCGGAAADQVCQALHTGGNVSVSCNGHMWNVGNCGGTAINVDSSVCTCDSVGWTVRPCINNPNWGGMKGVDCNASAQTLTVVCQ